MNSFQSTPALIVLLIAWSSTCSGRGLAREQPSHTMISPEMSITSCLPGSHVTAMPNCESWFQSKDTKCPGLPTYDQRGLCYCNQDFLNQIHSCGEELSDCFQDDYSEEMEIADSNWHSLCDTFTPGTRIETSTFTPGTRTNSSTITQPPVTTSSFQLPSGYDEDFCLTAAKRACENAQIGVRKCSSLMRQPGPMYSSCTCAPEILSNAYTCEVLFNSTCLGNSATVTNMLFYSWCDNFESVIGTGLSVATPTPIHLSSTTTPASPSSTSLVGPASTAPPIGSPNGAGLRGVSRISGLLYLIILAVILV